MTQQNQNTTSDAKMQRAVKTWFMVFVLAVVLCFFCDAFVLHPIPRLDHFDTGSSRVSEEAGLELVHTVYPDATIIDHFATEQFLVKVGDETHLLWFDMYIPFYRWKLNDDLIVPENATGKFTYGPKFSRGTVEMENGEVILARTPSLTWKQIYSFYLLIAALTASVALIPLWVFEKVRKQ